MPTPERLHNRMSALARGLYDQMELTAFNPLGQGRELWPQV